MYPHMDGLRPEDRRSACEQLPLHGTIHTKDSGKEVVVRRCSVPNECRWQVEDNQYSWANVLYSNARWIDSGQVVSK